MRGKKAAQVMTLFALTGSLGASCRGDDPAVEGMAGSAGSGSATTDEGAGLAGSGASSGGASSGGSESTKPTGGDAGSSSGGSSSGGSSSGGSSSGGSSSGGSSSGGASAGGGVTAGAAGALQGPDRDDVRPPECVDIQPTNLDRSCDAVGQAVGRYYARCHADYMELAFGTEANCAAYHQASCEKTVNSDDTLADLNDWLDTAGTMDAMDCICTLFFETPPILTYGTRAEGESCLINGQCESGACSAGYAQCGTCSPNYKEEWEPCTLGECKYGLRCNATSQTCEKPRDIGETCSAHHDCVGWLACYGGVCTWPLEEGQACAGESFNECNIMEGICGTGVCAPRVHPPAGDVCAYGVWCDGDAYCERTDDPPETWLCQPRGKEGDDCTVPENLPETGTCSGHLVCDVEGSGKCIYPDFPACD